MQSRPGSTPPTLRTVTGGPPSAGSLRRLTMWALSEVEARFGTRTVQDVYRGCGGPDGRVGQWRDGTATPSGYVLADMLERVGMTRSDMLAWAGADAATFRDAVGGFAVAHQTLWGLSFQDDPVAVVMSRWGLGPPRQVDGFGFVPLRQALLLLDGAERMSAPESGDLAAAWVATWARTFWPDPVRSAPRASPPRAAYIEVEAAVTFGSQSLLAAVSQPLPRRYVIGSQVGLDAVAAGFAALRGDPVNALGRVDGGGVWWFPPTLDVGVYDSPVAQDWVAVTGSTPGWLGEDVTRAAADLPVGQALRPGTVAVYLPASCTPGVNPVVLRAVGEPGTLDAAGPDVSVWPVLLS